MAGASNKTIIEAVKAMERELGLTTISAPILAIQIAKGRQDPDHYVRSAPTISPDGTAIAWWAYPIPYGGEKVPFLKVQSLKEGIEPVWLEGRIPAGNLGISSGAEVIVAPALKGNHRELLAIDRRSGVVVHDLTRFVTQFELGSGLEVISVSGPGTLTALGSRVSEQMQVLEIPSGKSVYTGPGRFPRLSPDGKRIAFVDNDKLMIHTFADGSTIQLLKGKRVKGVGGWSPDGRFLLAGAWTTALAFEKRKIIVDTTTGDYAVIGKLGEGDGGNRFAWVSVNLLER